jgi:hypothetical protein
MKPLAKVLIVLACLVLMALTSSPQWLEVPR